MKVEHGGHQVRVELTRRNLTVLLAKLDDPASDRTIGRSDDEGDVYVWITAVEDAEHYANRTPGLMYMPTSGEVL